MRGRVIKSQVDRLQPQARDVFLWDEALAGFGLKCTPAGRKVYIYQFQIGGRGGRSRRITIGQHGIHTPDQARKEARRLAGLVAQGHDPREDRPKAASTFEAVMEQFLERHARPNCSPTHAAETERILRREALPRWRTMPVAAIARSHVIDLLDSIKDRGASIQANRTKAALSRLFKFAVERGHIDLSPALMVSAPSREHQRERVLADDELARVWLSADALSAAFAAWFRFHMLSGQRLNESAGLMWSELDLDGGLWVLPAERSKNGKTHSVPLSGLAISQIAALPRYGEHVFTTSGTGPIVPGSKVKAVLVGASGVGAWTFHDLRRSCATWLEGKGYSEKEIGLLLNHQRSSVTSIYARHDLTEKKRAMLSAWADHLAELSAPAIAAE